MSGAFLATVLAGVLPFSLRHADGHQRTVQPWALRLSSIEEYHPTLGSGQPSEEGDTYAKFKDGQE